MSSSFSLPIHAVEKPLVGRQDYLPDRVFSARERNTMAQKSPRALPCRDVTILRFERKRGVQRIYEGKSPIHSLIVQILLLYGYPVRTPRKESRSTERLELENLYPKLIQNKLQEGKQKGSYDD